MRFTSAVVPSSFPEPLGVSSPAPPGSEADRSRALLASITKALGLYVRSTDPSELFTQLLGDLLSLTGSDYGYIAEVLWGASSTAVGARRPRRSSQVPGPSSTGRQVGPSPGAPATRCRIAAFGARRASSAPSRRSATTSTMRL